jgi:hypothetical protein
MKVKHLAYLMDDNANKKIEGGMRENNNRLCYQKHTCKYLFTPPTDFIFYFIFELFNRRGPTN